METDMANPIWLLCKCTDGRTDRRTWPALCAFFSCTSCKEHIIIEQQSGENYLMITSVLCTFACLARHEAHTHWGKAFGKRSLGRPEWKWEGLFVCLFIGLVHDAFQTTQVLITWSSVVTVMKVSCKVCGSWGLWHCSRMSLVSVKKTTYNLNQESQPLGWKSNSGVPNSKLIF